MISHHLHIFLSSPGDVVRERQLAREVIDRIQSERAYRDRLKLEVVAWDKPGAGTRMPAHLEPQEAIDRGLKRPSECDVVIVVFWARMGTPLSKKHRKIDGSQYRSGTEYEFLDGFNAAKEAGKPEVWVYRRKQAPSVPFDDPKHEEKKKQWDLVQEFFAEFRNEDGSYRIFCKEYDDPSDFNDMLDQDLRDFITSYLETHPMDKAVVSIPSEEPTWDPSKAPFPGLRAFTPEEALIFYGRGRETDELIGELSQSNKRFIAVVGASGSGKSSLVAAALLPALENNAIYGSEDWVWIRFTPAEVGDNPFMALANGFKSIIEAHGRRPRDIAEELEADPNALQDIVSMALDSKPDWAEVLLFIDQFEELLALVDAKYQDGFVDLLARAANTPRVRIVVTMRADFYHRCLEWPVLDALLADGQFTLLGPKTGALHEMITRPADRAGLKLEQGLTERVLDDTGTEPGALPLMAFALAELWNAKTDDCLTNRAYDGFGGVNGAIGKRAEDTFNSLTGDKAALETALARVFRELVEVDERGVAMRRRAALNEMTTEDAKKALVDALIEGRLLVTGRGESSEPMVEVAHEAIFTNWSLLAEWIEGRRDDLRLLRQVRLATVEWDRQGRATHFLWPHERLVYVSEMVERMSPKLSVLETEFIRPESERLLEEIYKASTTHEQRAKIGDRLAQIGDSRPGVSLRPDGLPHIVWRSVPGGEITLEKDAGIFHVKPFYIAKYPVTWIQYCCFLEAKDGFGENRWWKGLARREKRPGEQYRKFNNHPAENVSWYDAVAFCRWLTNRLGNEIRLPTEWEWQQAATGGDASNEYPWGPEWDSGRANTIECGLSRTIAVGLYPQGVSTVDALDMSGNVCEWCLNQYDNPREVEVSRNSRCRVLRGGSWSYNRYNARSAYRYYFYPVSRYNNVGFRLCSSSPIL